MICFTPASLCWIALSRIGSSTSQLRMNPSLSVLKLAVSAAKPIKLMPAMARRMQEKHFIGTPSAGGLRQFQEPMLVVVVRREGRQRDRAAADRRERQLLHRGTRGLG